MVNSINSSAMAMIRGSSQYPRIRGFARFITVPDGTQVYIRLTGLPTGQGCDKRIFGAHIHSGLACRGNADDPFSDAGAHFDRGGCPHPYHSGDMPPIFAAGSIAMMSFVTDRFTVADVIGRTIIIHSSPDDLHTQPSGNSGEKIACGVIRQ